MAESIKQLNNIRSLRVLGRELPLGALEEILEKFSVVVKERREEETTRIANDSVRREKLDVFRQMMLEDGIDPSELLAIDGHSVKTKKIREPRPARYQYIDENGDMKTWTGQGRTPKRMAILLSEGSVLEDFEIK